MNKTRLKLGSARYDEIGERATMDTVFRQTGMANNNENCTRIMFASSYHGLCSENIVLGRANNERSVMLLMFAMAVWTV